MRSTIKVLAALFCITTASMYVVAGGHHASSSSSDYVWSDDGHLLVMHSHGDSGVVVDKTRPTPLHGLYPGDVIVSVDGHAVPGFDVFEHVLRDHPRAPMNLQVRRAGSVSSLTWSYADYIAMFPPPPEPPKPPAPPVPPAPPSH